MDMSILNQIKLFARGKQLPVIPIKASDTTLIGDPDSFYKLILNKTSSSGKKLALSALYLGTGPKEKAIVDEICKSLAKEQNLGVNLVLDANRATRKDKEGVSSITVLDKILNHDRVQLSLIKTRSYESTIDRFLRKFQKWNELSSTYHTKFLVFDNDVIVTGANLSDIYFENRQDRYMLIRNCKLLSDYVTNLLNIFDTTSEDEMISHLRQLNGHYSSLGESNSAEDSYIIPLVQLGSIGLKDIEDFLLFLNSILPPEAQVHLASGYFNPSNAMSKIKINSILAPSEEANGFFGGGGLLKYVPRLYSLLHKYYLADHPDCKLTYYQKPGWSFHAKGMWITGVDDLYIHIIGSSNFNHRSSTRDLETELVLLTRDKNLSHSLEMERLRLWNDAGYQTRTYQHQELNPIYGFFARLVKSFL